MIEKKIDMAMGRLREHCLLEESFLCFSGGKCSVVIDDLAHLSGVRFTSNYSQTGIDPPELMAFIKILFFCYHLFFLSI